MTCKCMHCKEACDHDEYWWEEVVLKNRFGVPETHIFCNACDVDLSEEHPEMFEPYSYQAVEPVFEQEDNDYFKRGD